PLTAPTSMALACRWRSRPQHQLRTSTAMQQKVPGSGSRPISMNGHRGPRFLLKEPLPLLRRQVLRFEDDDKLLERARERKWHFVHVVLHHRSSRVLADIESFIERETNWYRLRDFPLRDRRSVHEQSAGRAFTNAAPIVFESKAHHMVARRDRLVGSDPE